MKEKNINKKFKEIGNVVEIKVNQKIFHEFVIKINELITKEKNSDINSKELRLVVEGIKKDIKIFKEDHKSDIYGSFLYSRAEMELFNYLTKIQIY